MDQNICLNCGSTIDRPGAPCPFCGAPSMTAASPKLQKLLSAAFTLLRESEFEKAKKTFEAILNKDPENASAYWGRLRARYHISYIRTVEEKIVPRSATRSAANLVRDIDYRWASFYAESEMKAFLKAQAEYLKAFCSAPDVGASKNITHQFTLSEVDLNDEARVKRKISNYALIFEKFTDDTYKVAGIKVKGQTPTKVVIPSQHKGKAVTAFAHKAFYGCSNLTGVAIPSGVTSIGDSAFRDCSSLTSITIPDSVTSIGDSAFRGCTGLTSISIPDGVTSIGDSAFEYCRSLTSISIPDGVTSIGSYAFRGCTGLTSITIPSGVTSIGDSAFRDCTELTSITIPDGVTSIGSLVFYGCSSLENITLPFVGNNANGTMGTHLGYIFGSSSYSNNSSYIPKSLKTVTITGGESIGDSAFYGCKGLTSISIPSGVTSIDDYAFAYCISLTSITIPSGVTSIGNHAFSWCTGLTRITFGGTKAQWSAIKRHLFWNWGTGNYTVTCTDGTLSKSQS